MDCNENHIEVMFDNRIHAMFIALDIFHTFIKKNHQQKKNLLAYNSSYKQNEWLFPESSN